MKVVEICGVEEVEAPFLIKRLLIKFRGDNFKKMFMVLLYVASAQIAPSVVDDVAAKGVIGMPRTPFGSCD